eukprot:TRINITY_DN7323_c0_g1_i2.p1 TRINITY_DN7323_c0_g1~~TRINITY_DN7323_c0_g1_i2.p1  ORF type:complete len:102 (-),score=4.81 TRINITY_DN7323_c0_g1_i2:31-336(-)
MKDLSIQPQERNTKWGCRRKSLNKLNKCGLFIPKTISVGLQNRNGRAKQFGLSLKRGDTKKDEEFAFNKRFYLFIFFIILVCPHFFLRANPILRALKDTAA